MQEGLNENYYSPIDEHAAEKASEKSDESASLSDKVHSEQSCFMIVAPEEPDADDKEIISNTTGRNIRAISIVLNFFRRNRK